MHKITPELESLGCRIVAVSFAKPERVKAYVDRYPQPFDVVSDPDMSAYRAFELGRTSLANIMRPGVLWRFVKILARGRFPRKPASEDDLMQLGGDFLLDAQRRLRFVHASTEPTDRPSNEQLLKAVRATRVD